MEREMRARWRSPRVHGFHVMAKPIGPVCNLNCEYCYYLQKQSLYADERDWRMSDATLAAFVEQYIAAQPADAPEIEFAWQGGEPTLMGVEFFKRVVELQRRLAPSGKTIRNAIQTNGVLIDDAWAAFLAEHQFLVGLSIDGPQELHDAYRRTKDGGGSFERVTAGLHALRRHGVECNALTVVNRRNADHPRAVYQFLKDIGFEFIQFIPIVEPDPSRTPAVSERSVTPRQWGDFLVGVFDEWRRADVGRAFVQLFDQALAAWMGMEPTLCVFATQCGRGLVLEHNGDLYSCDHFVTPEHRLGNIHTTPLVEMIDSDRQMRFGLDKAALPKACRACGVRFACNGECPKNRLVADADGEPPRSYLCAGYKRFFEYVDPHMEAMAAAIRHGGTAADAIEARASTSTKRPGRNDPCPCGSGKKFKKCCGK